MSKKTLFLLFLGFLSLSFVLYGNTFRGEFVWDDTFFTQRTDLMAPGALGKIWFEGFLPESPQANLYRPMTMFTFALNILIGGLDPWGFHLVSIVLNGLASFLVFLVVFTLFKNRTLAFFTALFYAFLPIHTEAVALMKARDELLSACFALLAWLLFLRAERSDGRLHPGWLTASALVFFLGLLSKEFTVMAPPLFYLAYWAGRGIRPYAARVFDLGLGLFLYGGFLLVYLWMRQIAIPTMSFGNDDIGPLSNVLVMVPYHEDFLTALKIAYLYIVKIFVPVGLTASYHFKTVTIVGNLFYSWRAMLGLALLGTLCFLAVWKKTRATALGVGALTFLVLYFPSSQFVFQGGDIMGERWMYLPSVGLAMVAGWLLAWLYGRKRQVTIILFTVLLAWYASVLIPRNLVWRTELSLFESMVRDSPRSVRGYSALAQYYFEHGQYLKAEEFVNKGLAISNQEPNLYVVSASIAYVFGKYESAEKLIRQALELDTFSSVAVQNYPRILFAQGKYGEALTWFDGFVSQLPPSKIGFADRLLYATLLTKTGNYDQSLLYIGSELAASADHPDQRKLVTVNLYRIGREEEAFRYFGAETDEEKAEMVRWVENF